jgi:hypothetical protein
MFSRAVSRIAIASAAVAVAGGVLAVPAVAQAGTVGPKQYFYGEVFAVASSTAHNVIHVACAGPASTGHPVSGQSVAVHQIFPPTTTAGYTGNFGTEIDTSLAWSQGTITVVTPIATFTSYDDPAPIPTSITVPCSGSGVLNFSPYPDPDGTGRSSDVNVTFVSTGV